MSEVKTLSTHVKETNWIRINACCGIPNKCSLYSSKHNGVAFIKNALRRMTEEYCWAITQAMGLRPITYHYVGRWISTGLPCIYANSWPHLLSFDLRRTFWNVFTAYVGECLYTVEWQNGYRRKIIRRGKTGRHVEGINIVICFFLGKSPASEF